MALNKLQSKPSSHLNMSGSSLTRNSSGLPLKKVIDDVASRMESYKTGFLNLNAYERHKKLVQDYLLYFPQSTKILGRDTKNDKTDNDIIRDNHRLLWKSDSDADTWEKQLAMKYYDKLFKEYGICDLAKWTDNKVGIRWRTEEELKVGKGQFICGAKRCENIEGLRTWEVNFVYFEDSQKMNALVKLRLCIPCSEKLNYSHKRKEVTKRRKGKSNSKTTWTNKTTLCEEQACAAGSSTVQTAEKNIWKDPPLISVTKSLDEEYDEYLDDLLL